MDAFGFSLPIHYVSKVRSDGDALSAIAAADGALYADDPMEGKYSSLFKDHSHAKSFADSCGGHVATVSDDPQFLFLLKAMEENGASHVKIYESAGSVPASASIRHLIRLCRSRRDG